MGLLDNLRNKRRFNLQNLSDVIDEEARKGIVQLAFLMAASDGQVDESEVDLIAEQFGALWYRNSVMIEMWMERIVDTFLEHAKNGKETKTIVSELLDTCVHDLSELLNEKQKQELTHYLISVMNADGVVDDEERALLISYKQHIGLDQGFFKTLKKGVSNIFQTQCPACKETTVKQIEKKQISTYDEPQRRTIQFNGKPYKQKRKITYRTYRVTFECQSCQHSWSKERSETKIGEWQHRAM